MGLTDGQIAVAEELSAGKTYQQAADTLGISYWTVVRHVYQARRRLIEQQATRKRYERALTPAGGKPRKLRPFSLLQEDHV